MRTAASASRTKGNSASASEWTATALIPIRRAVRIMRLAISPRLATSTDSNIMSPRKPSMDEVRWPAGRRLPRWPFSIAPYAGWRKWEYWLWHDGTAAVSSQANRRHCPQMYRADKSAGFAVFTGSGSAEVNVAITDHSGSYNGRLAAHDTAVLPILDSECHAACSLSKVFGHRRGTTASHRRRIISRCVSEDAIPRETGEDPAALPTLAQLGVAGTSRAGMDARTGPTARMRPLLPGPSRARRPRTP
jgi:hypothetical protein